MWHFLKRSQDEFALNFKGLAAAGFILPNEERPTKFQVFWFLLLWTWYFVSVVLSTVEFIVQPYELRRTLFTIFLINQGLQTLFRPIHLLVVKSRVEKLLQAFQVLPENDPEEFIQEEQKMREHSSRKIFNFSALLYFYNFLLFLRTAVPNIKRMIKVAYCEGTSRMDPEICDEDSVPIYIVEYWWFTDRLKTPTYYFLFSFNLISISIYIVIFCASDAFTCSIMVALKERCDFLVKMAPRVLMPDERGQITPMFKAWIKYHQHYEKLTKLVNDAIGPIVLITHVFAAGNIMVYFYLIMKDKEKEIRELALSFLAATAIQFFMYAYWGQQVINKGDELSRATLTTNQISKGAYTDGPGKTALMVVMARCCGKVGSEISGMGFFNISLKFYARIFSLSLSYLLIILQL